MDDKLEQSKKDRQKEIDRLELKKREVGAQPGSMLMVEAIQEQIDRLILRQVTGKRVRFISSPAAHNPRLWAGA